MAYKKVSFRPSTNIAEATYDEEAKDLLITFARDGSQYHVRDIDANTVAEFSRAPSAGRFYYYYIKDAFLVEPA
jgi:hypothetical protein